MNRIVAKKGRAMQKHLFFGFIVVVADLFVISVPAYAYLDPGTGSMILQGLAAAFFGLLFFSKRIIASVKSYLGKLRNNKSIHGHSDEEG